MRLIAVPLARLRPGAQPVATFVAQRSQAKIAQTADDAKPPLSTRILTKTSNFWLSLGRDGQDGKKLAIFDWKRKTYATGEKLMDRIEYEEWALKSIDPALGPSLTPSVKDDPSASSDPPQKISLLYPPGLLKPESLLASLTKLTTHRTPHHRTRLAWCIAGMPLTIPFALIPIVPNLPFFYLVWRAYSHWKAYKASSYLSALLQSRRVLPAASDVLDEAFVRAQIPSEKTSSASDTSMSAGVAASSLKSAMPSDTSPLPEDGAPEILLNTERITFIGERFSLDEQNLIELRRALQQTELSVSQKDNDQRPGAADDADAGSGEKRS
ncbi:unnamed protein product [Parajaminaea phylloscopi]